MKPYGICTWALACAPSYPSELNSVSFSTTFLITSIPICEMKSFFVPSKYSQWFDRSHTAISHHFSPEANNLPPPQPTTYPHHSQQLSPTTANNLPPPQPTTYPHHSQQLTPTTANNLPPPQPTSSSALGQSATLLQTSLLVMQAVEMTPGLQLICPMTWHRHP